MNKNPYDDNDLKKEEGNCGCNEDGSACEGGCSCEPQEQANDDIFGGGEIGILKKKIEFLETELKNKNDDFLRKAADLDNYRKRLIKEADDRMRYANQSVVTDFLPVLDNLELTLIHTEEGSPLRKGVELTIKSFKDTLLKHGVKEIDSNVGIVFNPAFHEALMMDNNEELDNNVISLSVQKGYTLNDRVIRAAKVKVNKK